MSFHLGQENCGVVRWTDRENVRLLRAMRNHGGGGHGQRSLRCPSPLGNVFETWGTWDCLPREAVP